MFQKNKPNLSYINVISMLRLLEWEIQGLPDCLATSCGLLFYVTWRSAPIALIPRNLPENAGVNVGVLSPKIAITYLS